jgi:hypothetical protein
VGSTVNLVLSGYENFPVPLAKVLWGRKVSDKVHEEAEVCSLVDSILFVARQFCH